MAFDQLRETDLCEQVFIKKPDGGRFLGYYSSLDAVQPLLARKAWSKFVTGYYINVGGDFDAVRVSYFAPYMEDVNKLIKGFVYENDLQIINWSHADKPGKVSGSYGGEELRFRRFLSTYTLIGLDMMEVDLFHSRCLLATFRWQIFREKRDYRSHFQPTFEKCSATYRSLGNSEKEQFWLDLSHWPNPPQVDWAHFLVNMVLGCDWNGVFQGGYPQPKLSIEDINMGIKDQGFQIPNGWSPIGV